MIAVINYNAGNVQSVLFALQRLRVDYVLTDEHEVIRLADKVIFPGVGEANTTMSYLQKNGLDEVIKGLTQPVLGICLGMQLLCKYSEENDTPCLGIIPQAVKKFQPKNREKVPHMGWNTIKLSKSDILPEEISNQYVYFVHSYYVENGPHAIATTNYVLDFCSALRKDNFWATQFHPEKSGPVGASILRSFLEKT